MKSTNLLTLPLALVLAFSWRVPLALSQAPGPAAPPPNIGQVGNNGSGTAGDGGALGANNLNASESMVDAPSPAVPPDAGGQLEAAAVSTKGNAIAGVALPKTVEDPESGLAGIMLENKWRTMSTNLLNSPMAIMHMTWQLTEPGVAQGFSNAVAQGGQVLQATYLQKLHESQKDAVMGGVGVQRALERMSCVRSERERATRRGEKDNWYKADAICRGALDITTPSSGAGTGAAPTEADMTGKTATAKDSPALLQYKCSDINLSNRKETSLVSRYLPENDKYVFNGGNESNWEPQRVFLERLGDVLVGNPTAPAAGSGGSNPDPSRNTVTILCLIDPDKSARYQALKLEKELWEKFFTLLEARCMASADQQADGAKSYVPFDPAQRNTFWKTNGAMLSGTFDFPGYQFKPATVDIIYGMFIAKELRDVTAESCTARLSPKSPKNNLDFLRNGKTAGDPPEKVRVRQEHIFVFNMLKWITYGQILDRVTTWKQWLLNPEKTTINSISAEERILLLSRVAAAADLSDLDGSLQGRIKANADEFQLFIARVNQLGASMSGQGGSGLVESFAAARDNGSGTIGSGIAGNGN